MGLTQQNTIIANLELTRFQIRLQNPNALNVKALLLIEIIETLLLIQNNGLISTMLSIAQRKHVFSCFGSGPI